MRYCETCRAAFQSLRTCPRDRRPLAVIDDPLLGHVLGDRYRVLERIASGGMGQVYRVAHTRIASLFAVKVLYGDLAYEPEMQSRFQREAEAAACLQSRYIVRVVDFGESSEGLLYLAMEHLEGLPLDGVILREQAIAPPRAIAIATQIARGLAHAHERGIVHRDLKPANVMLVREDDDLDVVRLLDFGIARLGEAAGLTRAGAILGTPEYMAPEQFLGGRVDARADLYALGILLYEMLAGEVPFVASSVPDFAKRHIYEEPAPVSSRRAGLTLPPELDAILTRLLRKAPEDRFGSARDVVEALRSPARSALVSPQAAPASSGIVLEPLAGTAVANLLLTAIQVGAPLYNAGDHAGCVSLYRNAIEGVVAQGLRPDTAIATGARLEVALTRAGRAANATLAAWELRYALDDVIQPVRTFGATPLAVELSAAAQIASPRYASGELELVANYYEVFALRLGADLVRRGGDANVARSLEAAVAAARASGGGMRGLSVLGQALDALASGVRATAVSIPAPPRRSCADCPNADAYAGRIAQAIALGAPAYNRGDRDGCLRLYRQTASEIATMAGGDPACAGIASLLADAFAEGQALEASQAAWKLRHAFDAILADVGDANRT